MWIYEQTKPEENLSLLPQTVSLPVQKAEPALPTVPETAPEPVEQLPSKEPCIPAKRHATRDCWLLAAAFLLGCTAAGVLQAVCDARQAELLRYYLDDAFRPEYLAWVAAVHSEEYYVNMMRAWYFATALAKQPAAALPWLTEKRLDVWTHNKTIQKAVESRRIPPEQKQALRALRIRSQKLCEERRV